MSNRTKNLAFFNICSSFCWDWNSKSFSLSPLYFLFCTWKLYFRKEIASLHTQKTWNVGAFHKKWFIKFFSQFPFLSTCNKKFASHEFFNAKTLSILTKTVTVTIICNILQKSLPISKMFQGFCWDWNSKSFLLPPTLLFILHKEIIFLKRIHFIISLESWKCWNLSQKQIYKGFFQLWIFCHGQRKFCFWLNSNIF